jgi:hypothetical protein
MIGAIGQLAGLLIGILSIIYLAIQIRAQTEERRVSAVNTLTVQWGDMTHALHDSGEFSEIYFRGAQSFVEEKCIPCSAPMSMIRDMSDVFCSVMPADFSTIVTLPVGRGNQRMTSSRHRSLGFSGSWTR